MQQLQLTSQPEKTSVWDDYVPIVAEGRTTHAYMTEYLDAPANYNELCHLLRQAHPGDTFVLHLNTPGGAVDSAIMLIDAINDSKARVVAHLAGTVASAGTMITMACDDIIVSRNLAFMCHEISVSGISGKFSDVKNMQSFYEKEFSRLTIDTYANFLTEEEIKDMHAGKELWFNEFEVSSKWAKFKSPESEVSDTDDKPIE